MQHLYLFNESESNAAVFGVGTYINQLVSCMNGKNIKITVCKTISEKAEMCVEEKEGIRYISIPAPVNVFADKRDYYTLVFFLLYPFIDKNEKNVFHFNYLNCLKLAKELKKHLSAGIILTVHYRQAVASENPEVEREFMNDYCDRVIVPSSHSYYSLLNDFQLDSEKINIIPNAIKDCFCQADENVLSNIRTHFGIGADEKVILFAGRIDANKNLSTLIQAFLLLIEKHPDTRLIIAGNGKYDQALNTINRVWGKITFTGFLQKEMLYRLYQVADIGVIPSLYEEFGYVAIEMMMHRIPVIANNTSGLAEIIENNITGKLIDLPQTSGDVSGAGLLFESMETLLTNETLCKQMGENARKRFLEKYEIALFGKQMYKTYVDTFVTTTRAAVLY